MEQCLDDYNTSLQSLAPIPDMPWNQNRRISPQGARFLDFAGSSFGMRVCVMEKERLAIGPPGSYEDDIVYVVKGARTPFVFRDKY